MTIEEFAAGEFLGGCLSCWTISLHCSPVFRCLILCPVMNIVLIEVVMHKGKQNLWQSVLSLAVGKYNRHVSLGIHVV